MTPADLIARVERRMEDARAGKYLAPVDAILSVVLDELRQLSPASGPVLLSPKDVGPRLGITAKTATHWAIQGKFPGAFRSSTAGGGVWAIPSSSVEARRVALRSATGRAST